MYFIYHIPNIKIGVSETPEQRVRKQGYTHYEVLETHDDIYVVSQRERELQKEYGLPVDKSPYYITIQSQTKEGRTKGSKNQPRWAKQLGGKIASKINGKRKINKMKSILDTIPTKQFITKDIREACSKFDVSINYWNLVVKEKSLVKQIHKGNNRFNPGIYEKVY